MILVPTRELANQVAAVVDALARALGMRTTTIFGGVGQNPQVQALSGGLDVVIACPGRLEDLIQQGHCDLGGVEITILDEADHMADLGFLPGVKRIMDRTPKVGQRMLFSATLDNGVDVLVKRYLTNPAPRNTQNNQEWRHGLASAYTTLPTDTSNRTLASTRRQRWRSQRSASGIMVRSQSGANQMNQRGPAALPP